MSSSALFMMVFANVTVIGFTLYFFWRVLTSGDQAPSDNQ